MQFKFIFLDSWALSKNNTFKIIFEIPDSLIIIRERKREKKDKETTKTKKEIITQEKKKNDNR